jgi:hypothetical protein
LNTGTPDGGGLGFLLKLLFVAGRIVVALLAELGL